MSVAIPSNSVEVHFITTGIRWAPYEYFSYQTAIIAFLALQWIAVLGRIYVRAFMVKAFGKDDIACVITLILATAFDGCFITIYRLTNAKGLTEIYPGNWLLMLQLTIAALVLYIVSTTMMKIALGLLLLRVLVKTWMKRTIYLIMAITVAYGTVYFFIVLFECGPPANFPNKIILGQCLPSATTKGLSYTHAILTALADLTYAILPIIFLWGAAFCRRAKISVGAILALGSIGCVCTFARIAWISNLTSATNTYYETTKVIVLMSVVELSIGLSCMSFATYKPLFNHYIRRRNPSYYYKNDTDVPFKSVSSHGVAEEMVEDTPLGKSYPPPTPQTRESTASSRMSPRTDNGKSWTAAQSPTTNDTASIDSDQWRRVV